MLRPAARVIMVNPDTQEILVVNRRGNLNRLCFPGGKVDAGENFEEGAVREVLEETGIVIAKEDLQFLYEGVVKNDVPDDPNLYQVRTFIAPWSALYLKAQEMEEGIVPRWVSPEIFLDHCMDPAYDHVVWEAYKKENRINPSRTSFAS